jgi:ABC-type multidrug transport system fused ATPase/permease subunit
MGDTRKKHPDEGELTSGGFAILLHLTGRFPRLVAIIFLLAFLSSLAGAPNPYLAKIIIDDLIFRGAAEPGATVSGWFGIPHTIWMIAGIVLLGIFLKLLSSFLGGWQCHYILKITRNALYEIRLDTAATLMGAKQELLDRLESSRVASRLGFDVNQIDGAIFSLLRNFVTSFFTVIVVIGFMLFMNPLLTVVVLLTMPVTAFFSVYFYRKLRRFNREESDRLADMSATTAETFGAMRVIRVFTAEPFFLQRLQERSEALRYHGLHHWTRFHIINLLLSLLGSLGSDIFLFVGGVMALYGGITFGEFFAFYGYQAMLWGPIGVLLNAGQFLQIGTASAEKVAHLQSLDQEPYLEKNLQKQERPFRGKIEARNLCFAYKESEPILRDLNFVIEPGTMTALVGQSGSGKTTLSGLLSGMMLPTGGELLIDGVDIRRWNLRELRAHMAVVLQEPGLFNESLRVNLTLGRDYPEERIWAALAAAHLDDFVRTLPEGLDTPVGINGARLSGGQKQRVAIARVFLKNPDFLILDEATSALDSETEKAIQRSFDALMAGRTSVVIAHRLSTIHQANQILVLHQGRLIEAGTHADLVQKSAGHYRELFEAQIEGMIPMSGATRRTVRPSS